MIIWLDEHLSPLLAPWIEQNFGMECRHVRGLKLAHALDREIFEAARKVDAVLLTKDADFIAILERLGPPPRILWLTCGNTSNANLKRLLERNLRAATEALEIGEPIVEIG
jgi:predicted nuclease of predicted toxin-antitoxin system